LNYSSQSLFFFLLLVADLKNVPLIGKCILFFSKKTNKQTRFERFKSPFFSIIAEKKVLYGLVTVLSCTLPTSVLDYSQNIQFEEGFLLYVFLLLFFFSPSSSKKTNELIYFLSFFLQQLVM